MYLKFLDGGGEAGEPAGDRRFVDIVPHPHAQAGEQRVVAPRHAGDAAAIAFRHARGDIRQQRRRHRPGVFHDGLPAREQKVWDSPWGKLGLCVCYDLSYTRVTDELIRHGARALIVPTMDVVEWGRHQHELHARVAPIRAAEYRVPIFRVASSGISQIVDRSGRVTASAPFPGPAAVIAGELQLGPPGKLPLDRVLAPVCVALTTLLTAWLAVSAWRQRGQIANRKSQIANP